MIDIFESRRGRKTSATIVKKYYQYSNYSIPPQPGQPSQPANLPHLHLIQSCAPRGVGGTSAALTDTIWLLVTAGNFWEIFFVSGKCCGKTLSVAKFKLRRKEVKREKCLFLRAVFWFFINHNGLEMLNRGTSWAVGIARSYSPRVYCAHVACLKSQGAVPVSTSIKIILDLWNVRLKLKYSTRDMESSRICTYTRGWDIYMNSLVQRLKQDMELLG